MADTFSASVAGLRGPDLSADDRSTIDSIADVVADARKLSTKAADDGSVSLSPADGGGQIDLLADDQVRLGSTSDGLVVGKLTSDEIAFALTDSLGGQLLTINSDASAELGGLRLIPQAEGGQIYSGGKLLLGQVSAPGMAMVFLNDDGSWEKGIAIDGSPVGLGGETAAGLADGDVDAPIARIPGMAVISGRNDAANQGISDGLTTAATYRFAIWCPRAGSGLRFGLPAGQLLNSPPTDRPYSYTGSIYVEQGTKLIRVTWGGKASAQVFRRDRVSDPVPVAVAAGTWLFGRLEVSVDELGQGWPLTDDDPIAAAGDRSFAGLVGATPTASLPANTGRKILAPSFVLARGTTGPTVAILGDSNSLGVGDVPETATKFARGYMSRALSLINVPFTRMSRGGDTMAVFNIDSRFRRSQLELTAVSHVIFGLLSNDLFFSGISSAEALALLNTCLDTLYGVGVKVIIPTCSPRTTSTDGWTTLSGQTVTNPYDTVRREVNAAIRSGISHPAVVGMLDIAALFEGASATGKWRTDLGVLTTDGTHSTQLGHRLGGENLAPALSTILGV